MSSWHSWRSSTKYRFSIVSALSTSVQSPVICQTFQSRTVPFRNFYKEKKEVRCWGSTDHTDWRWNWPVGNQITSVTCKRTYTHNNKERKKIEATSIWTERVASKKERELPCVYTGRARFVTVSGGHQHFFFGCWKKKEIIKRAPCHWYQIDSKLAISIFLGTASATFLPPSTFLFRIPPFHPVKTFTLRHAYEHLRLFTIVQNGGNTGQFLGEELYF